jgi:pSer/pThr/pTyr-binding forkhead associated (FHA) protein
VTSTPQRSGVGTRFDGDRGHAKDRGETRLELLGPSGERAHVFPVDGEVLTIGRRDGVDVPLFDAKVSREHARVTHVGDAYVLTDLQSLNGTYVNGVRIDGPFPLQSGDVVQVGQFTLRFVTNASNPGSRR